MNALFIANIELKETEGIFKKVCAQSDAVGSTVGKCRLITRNGKYAVTKEFLSETHNREDSKFYDYINREISTDGVQLVYIRHMIPNFKLLSLLKNAKDKNIRIYYEIPTYPYFGEQFKASRRKYRAIAKIALDIIFWPVIYYYIDKLVVIRSNTKSRCFAKMVEITNGVKIDNIKCKMYNSSDDSQVFSMVTVGTLYPYHGYDRVLKGMAACKERVGDKIVEFHVVGVSQTIDELKTMARQLGLEHVYFHGQKTTEELNEIFEKFDVGLGCLALHRRNADIDTTLKIIEYYCRGIPVVTSGACPSEKVKKFTIRVDNTDVPLNIEHVFKTYSEMKETKKHIADVSRSIFSWDIIMKMIMG